ncbi:unnamed protein product [Effrenium voratum]|nr:unnamed protein product [Effrenium voratum]
MPGGITNLYEGGTRSDYIVVAHPEFALGKVGSSRGYSKKWDTSKIPTSPPGGPLALRLRRAGSGTLQRVTVPLQTLPNPRERAMAKKAVAPAPRCASPMDQDFQAFRHALQEVLGSSEPSHCRRTKDEDVQGRQMGFDHRLTSGYFNNITEAPLACRRRDTTESLLELSRRLATEPQATERDLLRSGSWRYWAKELEKVLQQERRLGVGHHKKLQELRPRLADG